MDKTVERWTEDQKKQILSVMQNDVVYECIRDFLQVSLSEEGAQVIRLLKGDKPDDECLALIRYVRGKVSFLDKALAMVEGWRQKALILRKEDTTKGGKKDGKKG